MMHPGPKLRRAVAQLIADSLNNAASLGLEVTVFGHGDAVYVGDTCTLVQGDDKRWRVTVTKPEASDGKTA